MKWLRLFLACAPAASSAQLEGPQVALQRAAMDAPTERVGLAALPHPERLSLWHAAERRPAENNEPKSAIDPAPSPAELERMVPALGYELAEWVATRTLASGDFAGAARAWQRARRMAPDASTARYCASWERVARRRAHLSIEPSDSPAPPNAAELAATLATPGWEEAWLAEAEACGPSSQGAQRWRRICLFGGPAAATRARQALAGLPVPVREAPVEERLAYAGEVLSRRGWAEAEEYLARLAAPARPLGKPEQRRWQSLLADVALRKQDRPGALARLARLAASARPLQRAQALEKLAQAYAASDDHDGARMAYIAARHAAIQPAERSAYFVAAAKAAFFAGDHGDCLEEFTTYLNTEQARPQADTARWYAGYSAYLLLDDAQARTLWTALVHGPPSSLAPQAEYWLGRLEFRNGRPAQALQWWRRAARHFQSYYGALARAQLQEQTPPAPIVGAGADPFRHAERSLAIAQVLSPRATLSALAWDHPAGVRVAALWQMGILARAAAELERIPRATSASLADAALARAEACLALGAVARAARHAASALALVQVAPLSADAQARAMRLAFFEAYPDEVSRAAAAFGLLPATIWGVMRQESGFLLDARSRSNAMGLMQLLPQTARAIAQALGEGDDAALAGEHGEANIRFGAWYLQQLSHKYRGHPAVAVGAYNAGPQAMNRWLARMGPIDPEQFVELVPKDETRRYIKAVLANIDCYQRMARAPGLSRLAPLPPATSEGVDF